MVDVNYLQRQAHIACDWLQLCDVDLDFELPEEYSAYSAMYMVSTRPDCPDKISIINDPILETDELLFVILHQLRHAYQYYAIKANGARSDGIVAAWRSEFDTVPHDSHWQIELDANAFAVFMLAKLKGMSYTAVAQRYCLTDDDVMDEVICRAAEMRPDEGLL